MGIFSFFQSVLNIKRESNSADVLFFGLGNPGKEYEHTRHNIGFRVIDALNSQLTERTSLNVPYAIAVKGRLNLNIVVTVKPVTYMNRSGDAVNSVLSRLKNDQTRFIVIVDDITLPIGKIRLRSGGSHGGHNGLKSIIAHIGTDFPRLRVGIGPQPEKVAIVDYVLGTFNQAEEQILKKVIPTTLDALKMFTVESIEAVMNRYN